MNNVIWVLNKRVKVIVILVTNQIPEVVYQVIQEVRYGNLISNKLGLITSIMQ